MVRLFKIFKVSYSSPHPNSIQVFLTHFLINFYFLGLKVQGVPVMSNFDMNVVKLFESDDVAVKIVLLWKHVPQACENEEDIFDSLHMKKMKTLHLNLIFNLNLDFVKVYFTLFKFVKEFHFTQCPCYYQCFSNSL